MKNTLEPIEIDVVELWAKIKFYGPRIILAYLVVRGSWSFYLAMLELPEPDWGLWVEFFSR